MALIWSLSKSPNSCVESHNQFKFPKQVASKTTQITTNFRPQIPRILISASPKAPCLPLPPPQFRPWTQSSLSSSSSTSIESEASPSAIVFIKGLAQSTSEGSLKTALSQFGDVDRVKIIADKKTKKSLGFGYIWFTCKEDAQMAVKEMNGKFFEGRFILVTIARPGSCKNMVKSKPLKF